MRTRLNSQTKMFYSQLYPQCYPLLQPLPDGQNWEGFRKFWVKNYVRDSKSSEEFRKNQRGFNYFKRVSKIIYIVHARHWQDCNLNMHMSNTSFTLSSFVQINSLKIDLSDFHLCFICNPYRNSIIKIYWSPD